MRLPLKYGIPLLIGLWLASGHTDYGQGKTVMMILAMGVAMWTAFSLPRPRRPPPGPPEEEEEALPPELPGPGLPGPELPGKRAHRDIPRRLDSWEREEPNPDLPANGRGRRRPPPADS